MNLTRASKPGEWLGLNPPVVAERESITALQGFQIRCDRHGRNEFAFGIVILGIDRGLHSEPMHRIGFAKRIV